MLKNKTDPAPPSNGILRGQRSPLQGGGRPAQLGPWGSDTGPPGLLASHAQPCLGHEPGPAAGCLHDVLREPGVHTDPPQFPDNVLSHGTRALAGGRGQG